MIGENTNIGSPKSPTSQTSETSLLNHKNNPPIVAGMTKLIIQMEKHAAWMPKIFDDTIPKIEIPNADRMGNSVKPMVGIIAIIK